MIHAQDHYVPILKVKRGEKRALREIHDSLKHRTMPLLEIVELTDPCKTLDQHLDTAFKDLAVSVDSYPRCLLDCRELLSGWPQASEDIFLRANWQGMVFTPVTGVSRNTEDVTSAMNYRENGLALRLTREEFEEGVFPSDNRLLCQTEYAILAEVRRRREETRRLRSEAESGWQEAQLLGE